MTRDEYLHDFLLAYATCELWSGLDYGEDEDSEPRPLDDTYDVEDLDEPARWSMLEDCADFVESNWTDLADLDPEQCGHDFSLTRNGHGAGFWDRGLGARGQRLTQNSRPYGETNYYSPTDGVLTIG